MPDHRSCSGTQEVVLVGGGGHCRSVLDVMTELPAFVVKGIIDSNLAPGAVVCGIPVLGDDSLLKELASDPQRAFLVALGSVGSPLNRARVFDHLKALKAQLPAFVSVSATFSKWAEMGAGSIAMRHVIVNSGALIGQNCILNSGSLIEHDAIIEDHVHVSTRAVVNGGCLVGARTFVGSGAILRNAIAVCSDVIIGAGAVVVKNIDRPGTYVGNPARRIK